MASEMMRISGRGDDGKAKAIKTDNDGNVKVKLTGSNSKTIQTHNAVVIPPGKSSISTFIDTEGFDKLTYTLTVDSPGITTVALNWSHTKSVMHFYEVLDSEVTKTSHFGETSIKAMSTRVDIWNNDDVEHTISLWVYLK